MGNRTPPLIKYVPFRAFGRELTGKAAHTAVSVVRCSPMSRGSARVRTEDGYNGVINLDTCLAKVLFMLPSHRPACLALAAIALGTVWYHRFLRAIWCSQLSRLTVARRSKVPEGAAMGKLKRVVAAEIVVDAAHVGKSIEAVLNIMLPHDFPSQGAALRALKRGSIIVDGEPRPKGWTVSKGQRIEYISGPPRRHLAGAHASVQEPLPGLLRCRGGQEGRARGGGAACLGRSDHGGVFSPCGGDWEACYATRPGPGFRCISYDSPYKMASICLNRISSVLHVSSLAYSKRLLSVFLSHLDCRSKFNTR